MDILPVGWCTNRGDELNTDLEDALTAIRDDPAIMRQLSDLAASTGRSIEEVSRACATLVAAMVQSRRNLRRNK